VKQVGLRQCQCERRTEVEVIAAYIDHYHDRPNSRLDYKTPREVRATWDDAQEALQKTAA